VSVSDEDDVLAAALERGAALAGKDEHRLSRLLHPRFGWISHRGERFDLASYLDSNRHGSNAWHSQELRDPVVTVVGDMRGCAAPRWTRSTSAGPGRRPSRCR
jgi:hypothetical protein